MEWRSSFVNSKIVPVGAGGLKAIVQSQHSIEVKVTLLRQL
jgi:hypothetical protein